MNNQIQQRNESMEGKVSQLSEKICKAGRLSENDFAVKKSEFKKIRSYDQNEFRSAIGFILARAFTLAGFKNEIDDANKQDIKEMILMKWQNLSLEEIDFAFKLDRYSEKPVAHYQLFNASYVYKVLHNYYQWSIKMNQKISIESKKEKVEDPEEKKEAVRWIARDVFDHLQGADFYIGAWHLYNKIDIPEKYKSKEFLKELKKKQKRIAKTESKGIKALNPLETISQGNINMRCKAWIVCQCLKDINDFDEFFNKIDVSK